MQCEQVKKTLVPFSDGQIQGEEKANIELHLEECGDCRKEMDLLERSWQFLEAYETPKLGDDFTASIMDRVHFPQTNAKPKETDYPDTRSSWRSWHGPLRWAAAAVLLLAAGLTFVLFDKRPVSTDHIAKHDQAAPAYVAETDVRPPERTVALTDDEIIQNLDLLVNLELLEDMELLEVMDELEVAYIKPESSKILAFNYGFTY